MIALVLLISVAWNASGFSCGGSQGQLQRCPQVRVDGNGGATAHAIIQLFRNEPLYSAADGTDGASTQTRRKVIRQTAGVVASLVPSAALSAVAATTDETASFASPFLDPTYKQQSPSTSRGTSTQQKLAAASPKLSDEIAFTINKSDLQKMQGGFGLQLGQVEFRTNFRVIVKSVKPNSLAQQLGIEPGWVVVSISSADGLKDGERTDASGVATYFSRAVKSVLNSDDGDKASSSLTLVLRDPAKFRSELENFPTGENAVGGGDDITVSTKVAPAGDTTQRNKDGSLKPGASVTSQSDQVATITQLIPPKMCNRRATTDDLLEISYVGQVLEADGTPGLVFDGSAVKVNNEAIPGRGNDISIYFVLGKQPFGQFPPGWDVGLKG